MGVLYVSTIPIPGRSRIVNDFMSYYIAVKSLMPLSLGRLLSVYTRDDQLFAFPALPNGRDVSISLDRLNIGIGFD